VARVIELQDVHKRYRVYRERYRSLKEIFVHRRMGDWEDRWVLQGVTLEVEAGTTLGLIGPNGAGKSTILKLMSRILTPDRGSVRIAARVAGLIELGAGFQPEYTGRENVYLNASLLGLSRSEIKRHFDEIVAFSELGEYIDAPLRTYSSGMAMRLGFSIAINVNPELLLVDEVLAVGDASFQKKCYDWLEGFQRRGGSLVIVSHDHGVVRERSDQVAWIGDGRLISIGDPATVVGEYLDAVRERRLAEAPFGGPGVESRPDVPAIEVAEVRFLNSRGEVVEAIASGDQLSVEIRYRCHRRVETPVFGVALHRNDGAYTYGTNTAVDGFATPAIDSDGSIMLTYTSLPVLGGTYLVTVGIFPNAVPHAPALDFRDQAYRFRVLHESGEQGLVRFDHRWTVANGSARTRRAG
jgi:ABC-type polysaccharide/polyol phosphate transport system ATPase subunit